MFFSRTTTDESIASVRRQTRKNQTSSKDGEIIDPKTLRLFLAATLAVILAPGPEILYVLSRSMSGG